MNLMIAISYSSKKSTEITYSYHKIHFSSFSGRYLLKFHHLETARMSLGANRTESVHILEIYFFQFNILYESCNFFYYLSFLYFPYTDSRHVTTGSKFTEHCYIFVFFFNWILNFIFPLEFQSPCWWLLESC